MFIFFIFLLFLFMLAINAYLLTIVSSPPFCYFQVPLCVFSIFGYRKIYIIIGSTTKYIYVYVRCTIYRQFLHVFFVNRNYINQIIIIISSYFKSKAIVAGCKEKQNNIMYIMYFIRI